MMLVSLGSRLVFGTHPHATGAMKTAREIRSEIIAVVKIGTSCLAGYQAGDCGGQEAGV
jgi:hypothetical protein